MSDMSHTWYFWAPLTRTTSHPRRCIGILAWFRFSDLLSWTNCRHSVAFIILEVPCLKLDAQMLSLTVLFRWLLRSLGSHPIRSTNLMAISYLEKAAWRIARMPKVVKSFGYKNEDGNRLANRRVSIRRPLKNEKFKAFKRFKKLLWIPKNKSKPNCIKF